MHRTECALSVFHRMRCTAVQRCSQNFQQWPLSSRRMMREMEEMHGFNLSARLTNELGRNIAPARPVVQPWAFVWQLQSATGWKKETEMERIPETGPQMENWIFTTSIYWCRAVCYEVVANERGRGGDLRPDHHPNGAHLCALMPPYNLNESASQPRPHLPQKHTHTHTPFT